MVTTICARFVVFIGTLFFRKVILHIGLHKLWQSFFIVGLPYIMVYLHTFMTISVLPVGNLAKLNKNDESHKFLSANTCLDYNIRVVIG